MGFEICSENEREGRVRIVMRLTKKDKMARYGYKYIAPNRFDNFGEGCNKLGQLEDIEEELGIDLIILLKAVKNGIWVKHPYSIDYEPFRIDYWKDYKTNEEGMFICGMKIKNYGKTWALTKEELK